MLNKLRENKVIYVILVFSFSFATIILAAWFLNWLYYQLETQEETSQDQKIEQALAQNSVRDFMRLRIAGNEEEADAYLTESALLQKENSEFDLLNDYTSFEIISTEKTGGNKFRLLVKVNKQIHGAFFVERITVAKILDQYYVEKIEIAG